MQWESKVLLQMAGEIGTSALRKFIICRCLARRANGCGSYIIEEELGAKPDIGLVTLAGVGLSRLVRRAEVAV